MTLEIGVLIAFGTLILAFLSIYWSRLVYESTPRRDVICRFFANLWQVSEDATKDEVDKSEFLRAINEAKIVFARDKKVIQTIEQLSSAEPENQESILEQLAEDLAKASSFRVENLPKNLIAKPIYW